MEDAKCPVPHGGDVTKFSGTTNNKWWESDLSVEPLIHSNDKSNPYGADFDYVAEFNSLELDSVKADIVAVMKDSKPWWPADYGHYGPFFIRMAWHSAGTYRVSDGRGGAGQGLQRFAPLNSWPDNVNLDKARRILWPVKQKYGRKLSWADLMILAGNVALEDMGFRTFGFAGGRADVWEPDNTYWGSETEWLANGRYDESREASTLEGPLAAVQMGLIYVNPEGPDGKPDFVAAAADIRETFARMAMNDEETVALIAGGHAFGKTHGAGDASQVGKEPEKAEIHQVGLGWHNTQGKGNAEDTISSGLEVTWTPNPTKWDNDYLRLIYKYDWQLEESLAGAKQWLPINFEEDDLAPHAHLSDTTVVPKMLTTDLALRFGDPEYDRISRKFLEDFDYFSDVFARAWFKLTHRDMGPLNRYHGPDVPTEKLLWQDVVPSPGYSEISKTTIEEIEADIRESEIESVKLVKLAWYAASSFRNTDKRGGLNGARIALEPQINWQANEPSLISPVIAELKGIASKHNVSLSDVIALAGNFGVRRGLQAVNLDVEIPFVSGRGDATQEETDVESFDYLRPVADGFRNYANGHEEVAERLLIDKSALLGLTPPELVVLLGGLRSLGVVYGDSKHGLLSDHVGILDNSFFINLLSNDIAWAPKEGEPGIYQSHSYINGERKWTATRADLVLASNSVLRALAEVYASEDGLEKFANDFVAAWTKVMNADRFDT
jgi:catalase-peroxidase